MSVEIKYRSILTPEVVSDIESSVDYLIENYGPNAAKKFRVTIKNLRELLETFPYASHVYDESLDVRYISMPNYPFALYVRVVDHDLQVIAFAFESERQDPGLLRDLIVSRIKELDNA
jgi:plasmid stabilization system protein ParE